MPSGIKKVFASRLTDADDTKKEELGTIRWEGQKCYKYIQYTVGTGLIAGVAGNVAYYFGADGPFDNQVSSDLSDCIGELGAGVLQAAMTNLQYGWVQIKGPATLTPALTAGANGDALTPSGATDGTLDIPLSALTDHICAYAINAALKQIVCDFPF